MNQPTHQSVNKPISNTTSTTTTIPTNNNINSNNNNNSNNNTDETDNQVIRKCSKLEQKVYKCRHDGGGEKVTHW